MRREHDDEEMQPMSPEERRASDALLRSLGIEDAKRANTPDHEDHDTMNDHGSFIGIGADSMLHGARCACGRHPLPKSVNALPPMLLMIHAMSQGMVPGACAVHDRNDDSLHTLGACFFPDSAHDETDCGCPDGKCLGEDAPNPLPKSGDVRDAGVESRRHVEDVEDEAHRMLGDPRGIIIAKYLGKPLK